MIEELLEMREELINLEDQGLEETQEYQDLADEYQELALRNLPYWDENSIFKLKTYYEVDSSSSLYGEYDSVKDACDIGDELVESGEISHYDVEVS